MRLTGPSSVSHVWPYPEQRASTRQDRFVMSSSYTSTADVFSDARGLSCLGKPWNKRSKFQSPIETFPKNAKVRKLSTDLA